MWTSELQVLCTNEPLTFMLLLHMHMYFFVCMFHNPFPIMLYIANGSKIIYVRQFFSSHKHFGNTIELTVQAILDLQEYLLKELEAY